MRTEDMIGSIRIGMILGWVLVAAGIGCWIYAAYVYLAG